VTSKNILHASSLNCRFNSDDKTIVTAIDSMSGATCVVPVLTKHDLSNSDVKVEMSVNLADWVEIGTVSILPAITIASISPSYGPLLGGQPVLLTGTGMRTDYPDSGIYSLCCEFDGKLSGDAVSVETSLGSQAQCITPSSSVSKPVYVRVVHCKAYKPYTNMLLDIATSNEVIRNQFVTYEYLDSDWLTSLSPESGPTTGDTRVTLRGLNLDKDTTYLCQFSFESTGGSMTIVEVEGILVRESIYSQLECMTPAVPTDVLQDSYDVSAPITSTLSVHVPSLDNHLFMGAEFSYYHQPNKLVLTPELGTEVGGTNLVISSLTSGELHVYGNARAHAALCSFISTDSSLNKIHVVSARYTFNGTGSFLTCTTDFMHVGSYEVNISFNGIDFFSTGSEFVVVPVPVVSQVYPQVVTNGTGSIFLSGPNLVLPGNKADFCSRNRFMQLRASKPLLVSQDGTCCWQGRSAKGGGYSQQFTRCKSKADGITDALAITQETTAAKGHDSRSADGRTQNTPAV
jgi:hypothetical protein